MTESAAVLHSIPSSETWRQVGVGLVGPLPTTKNGNKYLITMCDFFSKWSEAEAVPEKSADAVAECLRSMFSSLGYAEVVITDEQKEFVDLLNAKTLKKWGVQHRIETSPQTNGLVESFNRTLQTALPKVAKTDGDDWDDHVTEILFAYRTSVHPLTGYSPFFLMFNGREPGEVMNAKRLDFLQSLVRQ